MLIDGKLLAETILENLTKRVEKLRTEKNIIPHLGVIVVGNDPATESYVRQKKKKGEQVGGEVSVYHYPQIVTEKELEDSIDFLQEKGNLHGLIIQLPLPQGLNEHALTHRVHADKDVDGFREDSAFNAPIAEGVIEILKEIYKIEQDKHSSVISSAVEKSNSAESDPSTSVGMTNDFKQWLQSKKTVVMGKGKTGGQPMIKILKQYDVEPTIVDSKTQNTEEVTQQADILICAVGNRGTIVHEGMIKKDAILIGIGMSLGSDGKLHGDYDPEEIKDKAGYYTPIPGGVGPVNAAMLLVNTVTAAEHY